MLLASHLEQISLSATAIRDLPFPKPKIFTNALLKSHDITSLIRDTEPHERALFTFTPSRQNTFDPRSSSTHENAPYKYGHGIDGRLPGPGTGSYPSSLRSTTVRTLLGGEVLEQIRKSNIKEALERTDVDVELLLEGAEKLCGVYTIDGAIDKIRALRKRYEQLSSSVTRYEKRLAKQASQLDKMSRPIKYDSNHEGTKGNEDTGVLERLGAPREALITMEDIKKEEEEIKELEKKKRSLEDRVGGMERDLGGLLR